MDPGHPRKAPLALSSQVKPALKEAEVAWALGDMWGSRLGRFRGWGTRVSGLGAFRAFGALGFFFWSFGVSRVVGGL